MAGSYSHIITPTGDLRSNEEMMGNAGTIENLGDAFEAIEEMYGMIWYLAKMVNAPDHAPVVEEARVHYETGLRIARGTKSKRR